MSSEELSRNLDLIPSDQLAQHLPARVIAALPPEDVTVFAVTDDASDTAAFSARYGFGLEDCANTIVISYKKDGKVIHNPDRPQVEDLDAMPWATNSTFELCLVPLMLSATTADSRLSTASTLADAPHASPPRK